MPNRKIPKSLPSPPSGDQSEYLQSIPAEVFELEELTEDEQQLRLHLERKVERAFYDAGCGLKELRDKRLFRSSHRTFEEYCKDRFGFERRHPYRLIDAVSVVDNLLLCPIWTQNETEAGEPHPNSLQILPTNECQVRPLTKLEPEEQRDVWQAAVLEAGHKVPSGKIVKNIVERLKEKPLFKASDFCQVGDVFVVTRLEGKEREYNGCWAIALALNEFTVEVAVHDNKLILKPENLNKIDSPEAQHQLPLLKERIWRLRDRAELDRGAYTVLESLGRQTYLTPVEERLLQCLEEYYRVDEER